ncbi:extracellular solute-binding protein [Haladaptatus sp. AB643]|uniref:extracellular solute-binding protein n=1 Tax=Haladaptatus sp. AB643 TaxID=2934174 RepID=UPI00209C378C|nr:extracellular solute-binding protein [Haladaptatus sp. AB643]MCO8245306.1 extracellular solute-binding protein [Haladaptatus sp. AB643]
MDKQSILRREYLRRAGAFGVTIGGASMAGCLGNGGGGGKPKAIRLGTWGGTWQDLMIKAVVKPYKKETGINAEYVLGDNTDRLNKIIAQKKNPPVDVSQQDGSGLVRGSNAGLWRKLDSDTVPMLDKIPDNFKGDDWVMQIFAASGLLYNPKKVKSKPTTWDAYLDPQYKGKVGLFTEDPTHDVLAFSLAKTGGKSFKNVDKAFEMYENVVKNMDPEYITSSEEYGKMFSQEKIVLGRYWSARAAQWESEGKPVTSIIPKSGAMTTNFGNAIPKNISDDKAKWAGKFIDFTLRNQAAKVVAKEMYYTNPNPKAKYPDSVSEKLVKSEDLKKLNVPDFDWIAQNRSSWRERANKIINKHG